MPQRRRLVRRSMFGYLNREWEDCDHVPVGPEQHDGARPARITVSRRTFLPRRNRFVFRVTVPKDFGTKEIVWTLTSKGRTEKAYGTLKPDYVLDDTSIMSNIGAGGALSTTPDMVGNKAPVLNVEGDNEADRRRSANPWRSPRSRPTTASRTTRNMPAALRAAVTSLPQSANGLAPLVLRLSRPRRRRSTFDPPQIEGVGGHARRRWFAVVGWVQ